MNRRVRLNTMCFSPQVSFGAGSALFASGLWTTSRAPAQYRPLAAFPLGFGVQQILEGFVWLQVRSAAHPPPAALGYLLFSHWFWPVWVPFSVHAVEKDPLRKRILKIIGVAGTGMGALLYLPLLIHGSVDAVARGSNLVYRTEVLAPEWMPYDTLQTLYVVVVVGSLLVSSEKRIRHLGVLLGLSLLLAQLISSAAVTSVWCFFAAVVSGYVLVLIRKRAREPEAAPPA